MKAMWTAILFLLFLPGGQAQSFRLEDCRQRLHAILSGTSIFSGVNNVTIQSYGYLYHGPVRGLNSAFPKEDYLLLTYQGKSTTTNHYGVVCSNSKQGANQSAETASDFMNFQKPYP